MHVIKYPWKYSKLLSFHFVFKLQWVSDRNKMCQHHFMTFWFWTGFFSFCQHILFQEEPQKSVLWIFHRMYWILITKKVHIPCHIAHIWTRSVASLFSRKSGLTQVIMAQMSPRKLPRGKAASYSVISLSDQKLVEPLLSGLSIAACNPSVETDVTPVPVPPVHAGTTYKFSHLNVAQCQSCHK